MKKVSKTEDRLYEAMLDIGLKPERQYLISRMKVDFAFPEEKLVIEIDGHYKRNSIGMKTLFERKRVCEKEGWKVENFTAEEVFEDADKVARRIYHMIKDEERKNKKLDNWKNTKNQKKNIKSSKLISKEREEELKKIVEEVENEKYKDEIKRQEALLSLSLRNKLKSMLKKRNFLILIISGLAIFFFLFLQSQFLFNKFEEITCQTHFNDIKGIIGEKMAGMDRNFGISDDPQDYLRVIFYGKWYNDANHDIIIYFSEEMYPRRAYYKNIKTDENIKELICNN